MRWRLTPLTRRRRSRASCCSLSRAQHLLLFIPLYQILSRFHPDPTRSGSLVVTYPTFALPIRDLANDGLLPPGIPEELENAAMIDGATRFQAFRHASRPCWRAPALLAVINSTPSRMRSMRFLLAFVFITAKGAIEDAAGGPPVDDASAMSTGG